jgi:hypothetical protein
MAKWEVDLADGRTITVTADSKKQARQKQQLLNEIAAQGEADIAAARAPEQVSGMGAFMLGAGRETDKLLSGAQDLWAGVTGDQQAQDAIASEQAYRDQAFANVEEQHPIAAAAGGALPYLAAPASGLLPNLAIAGGAAATRYGTGEEKAMNTALDLGLTAAPYGLGRLRKAFDSGTSAGTDLIQRADRLGYKLTPGERLDSRSLRTLEGGIQSMPMPSNPMHAFAESNQDLINRTAARAVGIPDPKRGFKMSDEVIGDTAEDLSSQFKSLQGVDDLAADEQFVDRLVDIDALSQSRLFTDPDVGKTVTKVFDRLDDAGNLKASDYQDMSSELKKVVRKAWKGESPDAFFAESMSDIVNTLDELAESQMSPENLAALQKARSQWRALSALENSRALHESGDVSGKLLGNYLRRTDKGGYLRGKNQSDLYNVARLSKAFPGMPDSGTAGRSFFQQFAQSPVKGSLGLLASPVISGGSNLYLRGTPHLLRAAEAGARRAPGMVNPNMAGRLAAGWLNPEDLEDE